MVGVAGLEPVTFPLFTGVYGIMCANSAQSHLFALEFTPKCAPTSAALSRT